MDLRDELSNFGNQILDRLLELRTTVLQRRDTLSDKELTLLISTATEVWAGLYDEQQRRANKQFANNTNPVWSAIETSGIVFESHQVEHKNRPITVWTWSVPAAEKSKHVLAGYETKIEALRDVLLWLVWSARDLYREERTAIAADRTTFDAWRSFKKKAGTWDISYPPQHHSEAKDKGGS